MHWMDVDPIPTPAFSFQVGDGGGDGPLPFKQIVS